MMVNEDQAVREAYVEQQDILKKYSRSIGLQLPATADEIDRRREDLNKGHVEKWRKLLFQGHGVHEFVNDKFGNAWLSRSTLLKPSRFLDALRLRTNTYGTRVALRRARKDINPQCRRCNMQAESLGHVLGNCTHTKPARIRGHDEIVSIVENKVSKKCAVFGEATVTVLGEFKKPDLVIKDQERLRVVDVTVRYEDKDNLKRVYMVKALNCKEAAEFIKFKFNCLIAEMVPIVVGCRGAIPLATRKNLQILGFSKSEIMTIALVALRSSIEMANAFMRFYLRSRFLSSGVSLSSGCCRWSQLDVV